MRKEGEHQCSDLVYVNVSTEKTIIGNLESISAAGCEIMLDERVAPQSRIGLRCVECPKGDAGCIRCRLWGVVTVLEDDAPLGISAKVEFTGGTWCAEQWKPRHLLDFGAVQAKTLGRAMGAEA